MNASAIIALWPSPQTFADEIGESVGTVYVWKTRSKIPARAIPKVFAAARSRGLPIDIGVDGKLVPASAPALDPPSPHPPGGEPQLGPDGAAAA